MKELRARSRLENESDNHQAPEKGGGQCLREKIIKNSAFLWGGEDVVTDKEWGKATLRPST